MSWKMFFKPVTSVTPEEGRRMIQEDDTLELLDVRQPNEYNKGHISGSRIIPLTDLPDKMNSLDKESKILVYCAIGGRSRVATQMLMEEGFTNAINLKGGFKAYEGWTGYGEVEKGLDNFPADISMHELLNTAYAMEEALELFYTSQAATSKDLRVQTIFRQLTLVEVRHKENIQHTALDLKLEIDSSEIDREISEAGMSFDDYMRILGTDPESPQDVVAFAMTIEAQAMDLYFRAAQHVESDGAKKFLMNMSWEEKAHLRLLGRLMDQLAEDSESEISV